MPAFAARIDASLQKELRRLAKAGHSPAEITRRLGDAAQARGLARPSYARVRELVELHRLSQRNEPS